MHIFLNGLDAEFDQLRGEILRKDPVLDFEDTYAYVRRDGIRKTMENQITRSHLPWWLVGPSLIHGELIRNQSEHMAHQIILLTKIGHLDHIIAAMK